MLWDEGVEGCRVADVGAQEKGLVLQQLHEQAQLAQDIRLARRDEGAALDVFFERGARKERERVDHDALRVCLSERIHGCPDVLLVPARSGYAR